MRIAHLTSVHDPFDTRIFHKECRILADEGHDVVLIAAAEESATIDGIRVRAVPRPANRRERMTRTMRAVFFAALAERADVYHLHDPELIPIGLILRAMSRIVVFDAHEDLPTNLATKNWIPSWLRPFVARAVSALAVAAAFAFNATIAATPTIAHRFPAKKTWLVCNYAFVPERGDPPSPMWERSPKAIYCGRISRTRGIMEMLDVVAAPGFSAEARLVLAGSFESEELLQEARAHPGWRRVEYLGQVSHDALPRLLNEARVGLVFLHPTPAYRESLPTKLFEYLVAGVPAVVSEFPILRDIVVPDDCGITVDPFSVVAATRAVTALLNDPARAQAMGNRGRELVLREYSWPAQANVLKALYRKLEARAIRKGAIRVVAGSNGTAEAERRC